MPLYLPLEDGIGTLLVVHVDCGTIVRTTISSLIGTSQVIIRGNKVYNRTFELQEFHGKIDVNCEN